MNNLRTRDGVVLLEIKNTYLLVSDKEARKHCRYLWEINDAAALVWRCIEEHMSMEEIITCIMDEYDIDDRDTVEKDINAYLTQLKENSYLIEENSDGI